MIELRNFLFEDGREPFKEWFEALDSKAADVVHDRLERARGGNLGDWKALTGTGGVNELRIAYGGGWRVYFGRDGKEIVILLGGGAKSDQKSDIRKATQQWADYKARKARYLQAEQRKLRQEEEKQRKSRGRKA